MGHKMPFVVDFTLTGWFALYVDDSRTARDAISGDSAAAGVDEGADAEEHVDKTEESERGFLFYGCRIGKGDTVGEAVAANHRGNHPQKHHTGHGTRHCHPEM